MVRNALSSWLLFAACALSGAAVAACAEVTVDEPPSAGTTTPEATEGRGSGSNPAGSNPAGSNPASSNPAGSAPAAPVTAGQGNQPTPPPASNVATRPMPGLPSAGSGANPVPAPPPITAPVGPAGSLLLFDDFEDGDAMGWIADAADGNDLLGSWAVVETAEGRAYAQQDASFSDDSWTVGGNVTWTDIALEARFRFTAVSDIEDAIVMLALRFQSKDDYYYLQYAGDGSLKIRKRVDGSEPELFTLELDRVAVLGEWIDLGFAVRGTSLEASVGGVVVSSAVVDTDLVSGGIALGVRENSAVEFDDVRVTVPE